MKLSALHSYELCANIRGNPTISDCKITSGIGIEGDLVLIKVDPQKKRFQLINNKGLELCSDQCEYIVSVLGNRDSGTHANGGIPASGLQIFDGLKIDWLGGMSGLVGICLETRDNEDLNVEIAIPVSCVGLLQRNDKNLNVMDFAVRPVTPSLTTPLILFAATSAEAGKTTLMCKVIQCLTARNIKTGAMKITGTGGVLDMRNYKNAGAFATVDQVNCGLISTYTKESYFTKHIRKGFRYLQDRSVDIILGEMGGDLLWGNNPALLQIDEIVENVSMMNLISNDSLALLGAKTFLENLSFTKKINYFSSPFRNYTGMKKRAAVVTDVSLQDINDLEKIEQLIFPHIVKKKFV